MIVKSAESQILTLKKRTFQELTLKAYLKAAVANTTLSLSDFSTTNLLVKALLKRDGRNIVLYQDQLAPLAKHCSLLNGDFDFFSTSTNVITLVAAAVGVKHEVIIPFSIDLGSPIVIYEGDSIEIEVTLQQAAFSANVDSVASFVQLDATEVAGVELFTPCIRTQAIQSNQTQWQEAIGDSINSLSFINIDKTTELISDQVLTDITLNGSNGLGFRDNYNELLAKRYGQFTSYSLAKTRAQSFALLPYNKDLHASDVQVYLGLNPANVNAGKNWVVWHTYELDPRTYHKGAAMATDNYNKMASKVGVAPIPSNR